MKKEPNSIEIVTRFSAIYTKKSLLSYYVSITDRCEGFRAKLLREISQLLSLGQKSNSGFGRLVVEVYRSHTHAHTHTHTHRVRMVGVRA